MGVLSRGKVSVKVCARGLRKEWGEGVGRACVERGDFRAEQGQPKRRAYKEPLLGTEPMTTRWTLNPAIAVQIHARLCEGASEA